MTRPLLALAGVLALAAGAVAAGTAAMSRAPEIAPRVAPPPSGGHGAHDHDHPEVEGMPLFFGYYYGRCVFMQGRVIDPMRGVMKEHEGREVRFCCRRCEARFDGDPVAGLALMDAALIEDQLPLYPLETCLVMTDHALPAEGAVNHIYKNRLVRFCCEGCIPKFEDDPEPYLRRLDEIVAEGQRPSYPMTDCVVAMHAVEGGEEGPVELVVGGRLVRLCCPGCLQEIARNPAEYVQMIDEARAAAEAEAELRGR